MHSAIEVKDSDGKLERTEPQRIQAYLDADMPPPMPELSDYGNMIWTAFLEAGPSMPGAMGEVPLSWSEADAYARNCPEISEAWEVQALVSMSQEYLTERQLGAEALTKAPMERE